jgi:hypothetical protein
MKKIFLSLLLIAFMASPAFASNGGGKKKSKKKAQTECKRDQSCDPKNCSKDDKCCDYRDCKKDEKCPPVCQQKQ